MALGAVDAFGDQRRDVPVAAVLAEQGSGDFTSTVGLAAQAGFDADSIGATAGSWAGAFLGYHAIPGHWLDPLDGRTRSAVFGFSEVNLDEMANRTLALVSSWITAECRVRYC